MQTFGYIIGTTLQSLIFCGMLFNIVLAINRALAIGSAKTNLILSRKAYNIIAMFIFPTGFVIAYVPPYVMTCCKIMYAYQSFSINFLAVVYDPIQDKIVLLDPVTYKYVHRPLFIIATIIPIVCYTYVFGYIFWMKRKMKTINSSIRTEIIRSILFTLVFFCYMCYPVNDNTRNCVALDKNAGKFYNMDCDQPRCYICQLYI
uniref:7TM GPCR serpentine receptor class x (Srx) domain-containing protein n=1 Tax=Acrobeloides nanus TaxID=290746 RepID=A0A914DT74_9BILA